MPLEVTRGPSATARKSLYGDTYIIRRMVRMLGKGGERDNISIGEVSETRLPIGGEGLRVYAE
jgi:hypothetical protein